MCGDGYIVFVLIFISLIIWETEYFKSGKAAKDNVEIRTDSLIALLTYNKLYIDSVQLGKF